VIVVREHPKIGWVLVGAGIALAVVGAIVYAIYYSYLQSCAVNRVPCANYSTGRDNGLLILGTGVVILFLGILMRLRRHALAFGRALLLTGIFLAILNLRLCVAMANIWFTVAGVVMAAVGVIFILKKPRGIRADNFSETSLPRGVMSIHLTAPRRRARG
jgi:hypothetical protein